MKSNGNYPTLATTARVGHPAEGAHDDAIMAMSVALAVREEVDIGR